ncbi:hypothetical protein JOQ06_023757 [Pogonophryne albipinna]|uniref:DDE Tnp4 domain-containing protein n=1 Tax=Pogonophryne albipinna TaxID=1090488 RepID=A0AAD6FU72_9TELE|nr:hypothetical protein JOQ06_023757 [Pogonophryne albipinna]
MSDAMACIAVGLDVYNAGAGQAPSGTTTTGYLFHGEGPHAGPQTGAPVTGGPAEDPAIKDGHMRLVHTGVEKIAALRQEVIKLPPPWRTGGDPPGPLGQDYLNRKLFPPIQLQAVCDGKGFFVGYPGSVHDTRVLKNSAIYKQALYPPSGFFLLGDGGYPCMEVPVAIITPYREPLQGRVQSRFNQHHARARSIVERAFGMMKTRWRLLFFKALERGTSWSLKRMLGTLVPPRLVRGDRGRHGQRDRLAGLLSAPRVQPVELQEHDYL